MIRGSCISLISLIAFFYATQARAETISVKCNYFKVATKEGIEAADNFSMVFVIDPALKTATMVGNAGSVNVEMIQQTNGALTFVEITDTGNVQVTAIDTNGASSHSRSTIISGELLPSQYYGTCKNF